MAESPPNPTLYISNLPDALNKELLKASLKAIVSAVAPPLDIVVMRTAKLRCGPLLMNMYHVKVGCARGKRNSRSPCVPQSSGALIWQCCHCCHTQRSARWVPLSTSPSSIQLSPGAELC